jgi:tetratricopeptide (TPR) repeat protein
MQHGNIKLAREYFDDADKALRQLGTVHEVRAIYESARFSMKLWAHGVISVSEATTQILRSRASLAASELPVPASYLPECDELLAEIKLWTGDVTTGLALYEASQASLRKTLGPDSNRRQTALTLGIAMMMSGSHDLADKLLREALELTIAAGQGLHPFTVEEYARVSENLRKAGKLDEAKRFLDAVPHFEPLRGGGPGYDDYGKILAYERVQLLMDKGDGKGAIQLLKANPWGGTAAQETAYYEGMLGHAFCLNHQVTIGLPLLKKSLAYATEKMDPYPGDPDFGQSWAEAGLCAFETGDKAAAHRYAAKARKVFAIQPGVSPYYKKSLQKLERLLGNNLAAPKG